MEFLRSETAYAVTLRKIIFYYGNAYFRTIFFHTLMHIH